jgi:ABC-2 type transport system ATP-binding protein
LKNGTLITSGQVEEILMDEDIVEMSANDMDGLVRALQSYNLPLTKDEKLRTVQIVFPKGTAKLDEINRHCFENGIVLTQLILRKKRLEARFFELTNN